MGKFEFDKVLARFKETQSRLPRSIARLAVNYSKEAFRAQGWTDVTFSPWAARKRPSRADRNTKNKRAILIETGNLRRSIRASEANWSRIRYGAYGIEYATYHNNGTAKLPRRRFIGPSVKLNNAIRREIYQEIRKTFR
jgi:phage gpG-like protein